MTKLKQIISLILWLLLVMSTVFNGLYLLNIVSRTFAQIGFIVFLVILFIISLIGLALKNIRREDTVQINIIMPIKEMGALYIWTLIIWAVTYFLAVLFK